MTDKTQPAAESRFLGVERAAMAVQHRFDPLPYLTPETLVAAHSGFSRGWLTQAARIWQDMIEIDDKLVSVVPNRLNGPGRQKVRYVVSAGQEKNPKAEKHVAALKYFYENLTCTDALNRDCRGGYTELFRSMMQARAFGYSVQEIVWRPSPKGITATFIDMPLQFFEKTTGRLRFLKNDFDLYGIPMNPDEWLVTATRDLLMKASAAARMFKIMPLKDWLVYCEKCAMPGLHGKTGAQFESKEWNDLKESLRNFGVDTTIISGKDVDVDPIDIAVKGELAYPGLIDRCDRALSAIWLGGDLGSMSRAQGATGGVMLQDRVKDEDLGADCRLLTSTLNESLDRKVIRETYGEDPLAWILVEPPQPDTRKDDIETDRFLIEVGFPMSKKSLADRYNRELPAEGDDLIEPPQPLNPFADGAAAGQRLAGLAPRGASPAAANERKAPAAGADDPVLGPLLAAARIQLEEAQKPALAEIAKPIQALVERARAGKLTPEQFAAEVELLRAQLPDLLARMDAAPASDVLEQVYAAALAAGMEEAAAQEVPA